MAKSCPKLRWTVDPQSNDPATLHFNATAQHDQAEHVAYGKLHLHTGKKTATVTWANVNEDYRRCGVGTRLYRRMLKEACKRGLRLTSDTTRSDASEAFWRKQVKKGRATCVEPSMRGDHYDDYDGYVERAKWKCGQYALKKDCPSDVSLAGLRQRRAARKKKR